MPFLFFLPFSIVGFLFISLLFSWSATVTTRQHRLKLIGVLLQAALDPVRRALARYPSSQQRVYPAVFNTV
jgi:type II secretory pathway pseudopilin PulG